MAENLKVLSAGAVQPGLSRIAEAFRLQGEASLEIDFATAPAIAKRVGAGALPQIIIAPPDLLESLATTALSARSVVLGRIGIGVMVRAGAPLPGIATLAEFLNSLRNAGQIIYNKASTGIYLDSLFERLGIATLLEAKTIKYSDFAAVRNHIANARDNEIGFGATTVIIENAGRGVTFVGALPAEIQNYTSYAAALTSNAGDDAAAFLDYLATPAAKAILRSAGID